jgi:type I restriction enzyme M protein
MTKQEILNILEKIGFESSTNGVYTLCVNGYSVKITINNKISNSVINYGNKIKVWNKSTSNFHQSENFVVLECVIRLLNKGYKPGSIELEKTWPSGHGTSGKLDILLKTRNTEKVFAMIECKTWGVEYKKEKNKALENGGQLFSYAIQEKSTNYLFLYTSKIAETIEYQSECIDFTKLNGDNTIDIYSSWDKDFMNGSIFVEDASCYDIKNIEIKKNELKALDYDSGRGLFNSFAEILRRNSISDKSNAFNKIFNLFVCKIYDEDTHRPDDVLDFQWKSGDTYQDLIKRLSSLYKNGIIGYLELPIEDEFFSPYSEFSFTDIYNEKSYNENFRIVKEIVELLQRYQIKYTHKHQFLGDFFEDLLNSGIKQEAGQFFTPIPLAKFIVKSMPILGFIEKSIESNNLDIIPKMIDYSCGAGHFLTEAMTEVDGLISKIDHKRLVGRSQKHFLAIKDNFYWAKDYIYGIEKDYRLSKTTKIAMFLNGDGDAKIINSDGLSGFSDDILYKGALKSSNNSKYLSEFDMVISNPPFSVKGFIKETAKSKFSLSAYTTPLSKEIECLFVERTYQLLKDDGVTGLILPLSILNNKTAIYVAARKILLLGFRITAICELRDKTFKPTNTTTVTVFAKKRKTDDIRLAYNELEVLAEEQSEEFKTLCINANIDPILLSDKIKNNTKAENDIVDFIINIESEIFRALTYLLNGNDLVYLGYSGEKKDQELFLGYRFSKSRGQEGLEILKDENGNIDNLLYDEIDDHNQEKISFYVRGSLTSNFPKVESLLSNNLRLKNLSEIIGNNDSLVIDNPSKHFESQHISLDSISPHGDFIDSYKLHEVSLSQLIEEDKLLFTTGLTYNKSLETPRKTENKVITASNISLERGILDLKAKSIYLRNDFNIPSKYIPQEGDIIISNSSGSLKHLGKVAWVSKGLKNIAIGGFLGVFRFKDKKLAKAIYYRLMSKGFREHVVGFRGSNINNLDLEKIKGFCFKVPHDLDKFYIDACEKEAN